MFRDQTAATAGAERRLQVAAVSLRNKERVLGPLHADEAFTELLTAAVEQDAPPPHSQRKREKGFSQQSPRPGQFESFKTRRDFQDHGGFVPAADGEKQLPGY